jgi:Polysaccharide biosynthesis enzyme WcbI
MLNTPKKVKIVVIGNCQASPIGSILSLLSDYVNVIGVTTVHDLNDVHASKFHDLFESAEIIISQMIADTYPVEFVRTSLIKSQNGGKVITMPNIFFRGYGAELLTIKSEDGKNIKGILGDYHNQIVLQSFQDGKSTEEALGLLLDPDYFSEEHVQVAQASFNELKIREKSTNVIISDAIECGFVDSRLFHTFNHPSSTLLIELAKRLVNYLDIPITTSADQILVPDYLATFIPAIMPSAAKHLKLTFEIKDVARGLDIDLENPSKILNKWVLMSSKEFVEKSYRFYDSQADVFMRAKIHPDLHLARIQGLA